MGVLSTVLSFSGFGVGLTAGIVAGYYLFVYFEPSDVDQDPKIRPLVEHDTQSLERIFPEIPLWVKSPDYERIDWLNKFLAVMWPYLDKAICKTAKQIADPIIAENTVKYKIDSVEFGKFTLGSLPPTFQGIKVYTTDEKEIIMEPSLKWAGNPNVTIVVKAYGLKLSIQVVDLQIFASPRITLKPLVSSFPCFANIFVSLMEKPHVDFGLKLVGADLMAVPGLYRFVQETIKKQVANMYLWPRHLEVPILDASTASNKPVGMLHVKIISAEKLRKKDLFGKSDPYVKLKLSDDKLPSKKTTVKKSNLNPEWNEEFNFVIRDPENQQLNLAVYDWEHVGKHEKMGMNVIRLNELIPDEPKLLTLDLLKSLDDSDVQNDKFRGQIVVEATYKTFKEDKLLKLDSEKDTVVNAPNGTPSGGGLLVVTIHEGQDLEGKHHTNPYVCLTFRGEVKKTKHIKKSRDPRWEEVHQFVCEEPPINEKIQVEVYSKAPSIGIHSKENLGYVIISLADVVHNRRTNEIYHLIDSKNGRIQIEMEWVTS
ncbi:synaptotagmin-2-like [Curcuma longa]|uniref:synaptotagmin-2-like n=1 Tax=Curcuma longa TaxID=136217 RepID=UPI003D9F4ACF